MTEKHVVLFNVPDWDVGWGYSRQTIFDTEEEAEIEMARLQSKNPDVQYRLDVFG
jgi:hypothetical protein